MNDKDLFPDYEPKRNPDTVYDYLRKPDSIVIEILKEIGDPKLAKLKKIIKYFNRYNIVAKKNPGGYQEGNIILGADLHQYFPSDDEILVSELGKMIKIILNFNSKKEIEKIRKSEGIKSQTLKFNEIVFRHVDVMGSGRFFYADKIEPELELRI